MVRAQIREAEARNAGSNLETADRAHALRHRALVVLLPPLMALVERRRLAGTLLYSKCAPHEVEWARQYHPNAAASGCAASETAPDARFIGYEVYLRVVHLGLFWLHLSRNPAKVAPPTAAQTQQILSCAGNALDLMSAPWLKNITCYNYEAAFVAEVHRITRSDEAHISHEHRDALTAAFDRLVDIGMLENRDTAEAVHRMRHETQQLKAKAKAENEAPERQSCAHCGARELHVAHFKRCSACKGPRFCSKDCQLANWPQHKAACKAARKAAAGAAADA